MKPVTLKHYFNTRNIALVGILAAIIFVLTKFISIPIPSPLGKTALSVGNAMCILSALLFGPVTGGLAAGIGNALVDLSDPAWAPEFWITFINKFLMAFVAGLVMHHFKPVSFLQLPAPQTGRKIVFRLFLVKKKRKKTIAAL